MFESYKALKVLGLWPQMYRRARGMGMDEGLYTAKSLNLKRTKPPQLYLGTPGPPSISFEGSVVSLVE